MKQKMDDSQIDRAVQFAGVIREIPLGLDPSSRSEVLTMIDQGKRQQIIPIILRQQYDAKLCINTCNLKIYLKDNQEPILWIPIHQVAAVSYIKEDDQHILGIKFSDGVKSHPADDTLSCNLAVLYCDSRVAAEEICSYVDRCFESIIMDATMNFFDKTLIEGAKAAHKDGLFTNMSNNNTTPLMNLGQFGTDHGHLGFLSHSSLNVGNVGTLSSGTAYSYMTWQSTESELSPAANELILDYMKKLYTKLDTDELQQFALLVKAWHTNITFPDFCQKVLDLYGPERKHLLVGMRPFIPAKDSTYFECFLQSSGFMEGESEINQLSNQRWTTLDRTRHQCGSFDSLTDSFEVIDEVSIEGIRKLGSNSSINML